MSEPESQSERRAAHCSSRERQAVRRPVHRGPYTCDVDVVQYIVRLEPKLQVAPLAEPKSSPKRRIQGDRARTGNRVPPGVAELARQRKNERQRVEVASARIDRRSSRQNE